MDTGKHEDKGKDEKFFADYDNLTVGEVLTYAAKGDDALRTKILEHERGNKNRQPIIIPLVNWNS